MTRRSARRPPGLRAQAARSPAGEAERDHGNDRHRDARKPHDALGLGCERHGRGLVSVGTVQGRKFRAKGTVSGRLGTAGGVQMPRAVGAGSTRPNPCPWVSSGLLTGPGAHSDHVRCPDTAGAGPERAHGWEPIPEASTSMWGCGAGELRPACTGSGGGEGGRVHSQGQLSE